MANTGVLPFVRGVDFSKNNFAVSDFSFSFKKYNLMFASIYKLFIGLFLQEGKFPESVRLMTGIQWLKLDSTNLSEIPEEMGKLLKLV